MNKTAALLPFFLLPSIACVSNEQTAEEVAVATGQAISALSTNAAIGTSAASANANAMGDEVSDAGDPKAPTDVDGGSCVTSSLMGGALVVDYGQSCTIGAHTYSGSYAIRLSLIGGLALSIDFVEFSVDAKTQRGDMSIGIGRGFVDAHIDLEIEDAEDKRDVEFDGRVDADATGADLSGSGRYADSAREGRFSTSNVHINAGDCLPSAGEVTVELSGYPSAVVSFDAQTPITSMATITVGAYSTKLQLPGC